MVHADQDTLRQMAESDRFPWERQDMGRQRGTVHKFLLAYAELQASEGRLPFNTVACRHGLRQHWLKQYTYRWSNYLLTGDPELCLPSLVTRTNDDGGLNETAETNFCNTDL
jgi:hypothetical protein